MFDVICYAGVSLMCKNQSSMIEKNKWGALDI